MSLISAVAVSLLAFTATAAPLAPRVSLGPGTVALGNASTYAILAQTGISSIPTTSITGNIGVSPVPASYITGLALTYASGSPYATSSSVVGQVFAADYGNPTPVNLQNAIGDSNAAFLYAVGLENPDFLNLGAGGIGGLTLAPGLYHWTTGVSAASDVTLSGSPTDTWIFQIDGNFGLPSGVQVILAGGALPANIFWAVKGGVTFGTTSHAEGIVSSKTAISLLTGATANGRLFAQTAVTLQKATLVEPVN